MDWKTFITTMSGPAQAVLRYALTALGVWLGTKYGVSEETWTALSGWLLAGVATLVGVLTSTKSATIAKTTTYSDVAGVQKTDGTVVR